ncbi:glycosyltransferase family 2 protein [Faecalibacter bovis]|uniref:Glycosyltransferase family 2 protein n=1 Tax=Faecalibacter bovis TaxID=2898187 RepID=A0ABX7XFF5_9FLAO|nr:glycosyltransferase family 2 protein [Faecalibacter bovis]QTV06630.1 glycosyltransferase family 2 protein [Faecalibacter bovis]
MKVLVSLIIPFYNVEEFIEKSIRSVANQTYNNIEVIIVNDGSTDNSLKIVESVIKEDNRFRIIHQENAGLSAARNTGLHVAKGDYIFYLDSDDFLTNDAIEKLVNIAINNNADVVQGNFYYDYPDYLLLNNHQKQELLIFDRNDAMNALLDHQLIMNFAWGKLIKASIAKELLFPVGEYFEDTLWQTKIIQNSNKYVTYKEPILYYLQRNTGISGQFSIRNLDQLNAEHHRLLLIEKHFPFLSEKAKSIFKNKILNINLLVNSLKQEDQIKFKRSIEEKVKYWNLDQTYWLDFFIHKNYIFRNIALFLQKIVNRLTNQSKWEKIQK